MYTYAYVLHPSKLSAFTTRTHNNNNVHEYHCTDLYRTRRTSYAIIVLSRPKAVSSRTGVRELSTGDDRNRTRPPGRTLSPFPPLIPGWFSGQRWTFLDIRAVGVCSHENDPAARFEVSGDTRCTHETMLWVCLKYVVFSSTHYKRRIL